MDLSLCSMDSSCFSASRFSQARLMSFAVNAHKMKNKVTAPIQTNANFHMTLILIRCRFDYAKVVKIIIASAVSANK